VPEHHVGPPCPVAVHTAPLVARAASSHYPLLMHARVAKTSLMQHAWGAAASSGVLGGSDPSPLFCLGCRLDHLHRCPKNISRQGR
jgi:hypothetical protein